VAVSKHYLIYISKRADVTAEQVQEKIDLAIDWFRIDPKNWIVYTTSDADKWQERLRQLVDPGGHLFICRLDLSNRQGWMVPKFWEWLRKRRDS
jgi:hypothetical protein